jgi:hypothetical protein
MCARIGDVVKLVRPHRAFGLLGQAARGVHEVPRVGELGRRHQDQLGAQRAQRVHLLLRLVVRHHDDRVVAQRVGHQRHADPGITGRPFNDRSPGLEFAARFEVADDPQRRAVLH